MNARNIFSVLLVILIALSAVYWFTTPHSDELVLTGTVDADQVVVSSKIMGRLEQVTVEDGQSVKAGDLIALVDSAQWLAQQRAAEAQLASLRSQVESNSASAASTSGDTANQVSNASATLHAAEAALQEDEANLQLQQTNTARTVRLAEQGVASQQDRDEAESALAAKDARVQAAREQIAAAEAALQQAHARTNQATAAENTVSATRGQVRSAQAQLTEAAVKLGYTKIYAPVDARVNVRVARPGEIVNPGLPIVVLVDLSRTWVYAPVPETYADNIELGDHLTIRMPNGTTPSGKVISKSAEADFATQHDVGRMKRDIKTIQLKLLIDNSKMEYVPGMTAEVLLSPEKLKLAHVHKEVPMEARTR